MNITFTTSRQSHKTMTIIRANWVYAHVRATQVINKMEQNGICFKCIYGKMVRDRMPIEPNHKIVFCTNWLNEYYPAGELRRYCPHFEGRVY